MEGPTKFVILGTQRTGTTLVRTLLGSHPQILCCGEAFLLGRRPYVKDDGYWRYARRSPGNRIRAALSPQRSAAAFLDDMYAQPEFDAIGFKLMLRHYQARPYLLDLLAERAVKAILVYRQNALKTLVSRRSAAESGVYHISQSLKVASAVEEWKPKSIILDTSTLLDDLESINKETETWRSRLKDRFEKIEVGYEDHVADIESGNRRILDFLGVRQLPLSSDLKKVNPEALQKSIGNYEEVRRTLEDTPFERFLDLA